MDPFHILRENMFRFKTKNLNEQTDIEDYHGQSKTWDEWKKLGFNWYGQYNAKQLTSMDNVLLHFKPAYMESIPKNTTKIQNANLKNSFLYFKKTLKNNLPDVNFMNMDPDSGLIYKDEANKYIFAYIKSDIKNLQPAIIKVTQSKKQTWDQLTNKAWRTSKISADIPLDSYMLFTDMYVKGPAKVGAEYALQDNLKILASNAGIRFNKSEFRNAGGRVIERTNVQDLNNPDKPSELQYMVAFIDDPAYDDIRLQTYPDIDNHIWGRGVKTIDKSIREI